eukprot:TRINITY_DN10650_c0_g2_i2.p2 TRINITY_DN10650_c0_g2~~TRINITY_DN10650_c0_g2_i2.p2  ORF type:complete len:136 (-),score=2.72 TRINITY_DN10650_c0_g2_i2:806-1183(-)
MYDDQGDTSRLYLLAKSDEMIDLCDVSHRLAGVGQRLLVIWRPVFRAQCCPFLTPGLLRIPNSIPPSFMTFKILLPLWRSRIIDIGTHAHVQTLVEAHICNVQSCALAPLPIATLPSLFLMTSPM